MGRCGGFLPTLPRPALVGRPLVKLWPKAWRRRKYSIHSPMNFYPCYTTWRPTSFAARGSWQFALAPDRLSSSATGRGLQGSLHRWMRPAAMSEEQAVTPIGTGIAPTRVSSLAGPRAEELVEICLCKVFFWWQIFGLNLRFWTIMSYSDILLLVKAFGHPKNSFDLWLETRHGILKTSIFWKPSAGEITLVPGEITLYLKATTDAFELGTSDIGSVNVEKCWVIGNENWIKDVDISDDNHRRMC